MSGGPFAVDVQGLVGDGGLGPDSSRRSPTPTPSTALSRRQAPRRSSTRVKLMPWPPMCRVPDVEILERQRFDDRESG
jgi:hypothetical protein